MQYKSMSFFSKTFCRLCLFFAIILCQSCNAPSDDSLKPTFSSYDVSLFSSVYFDDLMFHACDSSYCSIQDTIIIGDSVAYVEDSHGGQTVTPPDTSYTQDSTVADSSEAGGDTTGTFTPALYAVSNTGMSALSDSNALVTIDSLIVVDNKVKARLAKVKATILASEDFSGLSGVSVQGEKYNDEKFAECLDKYLLNTTDIKLTHSRKTIKLPSVLCTRYFSKNSLNAADSAVFGTKVKSEVLATCKGNPVAVKFNAENGNSITLVSVPLIFTNYSVCYDSLNSRGLIRLLADCGLQNPDDDHLLLPFCRYYVPDTTSYNYTYLLTNTMSQKEKDELSSGAERTLSQILWGMLKYLLPFLLVLLVPLCIRRRQQMIPVIDGPVNRTAYFVKQISKLYLQNGEYSLILRKRIIYFFNDVKDRFHIQLADKDELQANVDLLAAIAGKNANELTGFIGSLQNILNGANISKNEFKTYIDRINQLTADLKDVKV